MCELGLVLEKVDIKPGQVLILKSEKHISEGQYDQMNKCIKEAFGGDIKVALFEPGLDLFLCNKDGKCGARELK